MTRILALAGTLTTAAWLEHGLFYGLGRPGTWLLYAVVVDGATFATTLVLAPQGLTAIATGFLVVAVVATVGRAVMVGSVVGLSWRCLARPYLNVLVVILVSGGGGWLVLGWTAGSPWGGLVTASLVVVLLHVGVSTVVAHDTVSDFAGVAIRLLRRTRSKPMVAQ